MLLTVAQIGPAVRAAGAALLLAAGSAAGGAARPSVPRVMPGWPVSGIRGGPVFLSPGGNVVVVGTSVGDTATSRVDSVTSLDPRGHVLWTRRAAAPASGDGIEARRVDRDHNDTYAPVSGGRVDARGQTIPGCNDGLLADDGGCVELYVASGGGPVRLRRRGGLRPWTFPEDLYPPAPASQRQVDPEPLTHPTVSVVGDPDGVVYTIQRGDLIAVDGATGALRNREVLDSNLPVAVAPVDGGVIVTGKFETGLHDGGRSPRWTLPVLLGGFGTLVDEDPRRHRVYLQTEGDGVLAVDSRSGRVEFRYRSKNPADPHASLMSVGRWSGNAYIVTLDRQGRHPVLEARRPDGTVAFRYPGSVAGAESSPTAPSSSRSATRPSCESTRGSPPGTPRVRPRRRAVPGTCEPAAGRQPVTRRSSRRRPAGPAP